MLVYGDHPGKVLTEEDPLKGINKWRINWEKEVLECVACDLFGVLVMHEAVCCAAVHMRLRLCARGCRVCCLNLIHRRLLSFSPIAALLPAASCAQVCENKEVDGVVIRPGWVYGLSSGHYIQSWFR